MNAEDTKTLRPDVLTPAELDARAEVAEVGKANMPFKQAFWLAAMTGLFIACGGMFMLLIKSDASFFFAPSQLLGSLVFCLGLFLVTASGAELFTGNTLRVAARLSASYS